MEKISIDWQSNMSFQAHVDHFNITLDAAPENGGDNNGMRPKPLLLVAMAGCTGMDIASLSKKMRVELTNFSVDVEAEKSEAMPIVYTSFRVIYHFEGSEDDRQKILKMVHGSQEKYCGVAEMFRHIAPVSFQVYLNKVLI